jgi:hypothetical protein
VSTPRPLEDTLLSPVELAIDDALGAFGIENHEARLELLEAVACELAGLDFGAYRALGNMTKQVPIAALRAAAPKIVEALLATPIPPALALTALSRESLSYSDQRKAGSYYTDFRLAQFLAHRAVKLKPLKRGDLVIDPASGTGILLVAVALAACGDNRSRLNDFVHHSACAGDLSPTTLRGVRLALASLAGDLSAVAELDKRLRAGDSLVGGAAAWADVAPNGFALVIGNPPWEKLKISRHEHLGAAGALRHYGDDYDAHQELEKIDAARSELAEYVSSLEYELQGKGDPDLYKLFLALSSALVAHGGQIAILVPAGLIRSEGTQQLREYLFAAAPDLRIAVLDNKARFFSIDTRFKFLALNAVIDPSAPTSPLVFEHATGSDTEIVTTGSATLQRSQLAVVRPDLSVPEVRSNAEWKLFRRLANEGVMLGAPGGAWDLHFSREVDMTNNRGLFERSSSDGAMALIEGRMVHQFRHTAKAYVSGTGRRADWVWQAPSEAELRPQFWVDAEALPEATQVRASRKRVGFCDITGQTNERAMLAATIPAGVVCGNKVPTIIFRNADGNEDHLAGVFLAVANSFVFDWLLRRVLTTTVNYFLLLSLPFPPLDLDGSLAKRLASLALDVGWQSEGGADPDAATLASLRVELDALVMEAYGITPTEAALILRDFPLLDRGQPALPGEARSTITRDLLLQRVKENHELVDDRLTERVDLALAAGVEAYVPSQLARRKASQDSLTVA